MPRIVSTLLVVLIALQGNIAYAQDAKVEYRTQRNIAYYLTDDQTEYMRERCKLDIYYPTQGDVFATVVWFHAGGLKGGERFIPGELRNKGFAIVAVDYRLSPKVKAPAYIEDAAAAVAWTAKHIEQYGGDPAKIFIAGHSAGGYLVSMLGLDKQWLKKHEFDADRLAGVIPFSGHTITHFTIREERGIAGTKPVIDELAPLYHIRKDAPPMLLVTGDREKEMLGRYEENTYFWRMMKVVGHKDCELLELDGYDHGNMPKGGYPLLADYIQKRTKPTDDK